jgi:RHS repeat-associated protein
LKLAKPPPRSANRHIGGQFGYAGSWGYQEDKDSGLKLLGHRYYDPSTGRFLTRDPVKEGRNWYDYCDNEPLRRTDASGNDWWPEPWQGDVQNNAGPGIVVIVIGEPGPGKPPEAIILGPGERDPDNFDADRIVVIINGKPRWYDIGAGPGGSGSVVIGPSGAPHAVSGTVRPTKPASYEPPLLAHPVHGGTKKPRRPIGHPIGGWLGGILEGVGQRSGLGGAPQHPGLLVPGAGGF